MMYLAMRLKVHDKDHDTGGDPVCEEYLQRTIDAPDTC
jgi:hypothetical protein